jgi:hypothetical protein
MVPAIARAREAIARHKRLLWAAWLGSFATSGLALGLMVLSSSRANSVSVAGFAAAYCCWLIFATTHTLLMFEAWFRPTPAQSRLSSVLRVVRQGFFAVWCASYAATWVGLGTFLVLARW